MLQRQSKQPGEPLNPNEARELQKLLDDVGEMALARMTGLSRQTICRAVARRRLYGGSRGVIRQLLATSRQAA